MKKLSARALAALTNAFLAVVILLIGAVCFLPSVSTATNLEGKVYYKGTSKDGVSLMFNVYWGTEQVYGILGVLDEYGVKATFFIGGSWADDNVECLREIAARGHEIGSHGYFHKDQDKLSLQGNLDEIRNSVEFISKAAGVSVSLFAPPSGAYNDDTVAAAESLGLKTVMWSKDTIDWRDKDKILAYRRATENAAGGDLVLMHPMEHTLSALPEILTYYREHALRVVTVGENIGLKSDR